MIDRFIRPSRHPNLAKVIVGGVCLDAVLGLGALAYVRGASSSDSSRGQLAASCKAMEIGTFASTDTLDHYEEGRITATIVDGNYSESQVKAFAAQSFLMGVCDHALRQGMEVSISPLTIECDNLKPQADGRSFDFDCNGLVTIDLEATYPQANNKL